MNTSPRPVVMRDAIINDYREVNTYKDLISLNNREREEVRKKLKQMGYDFITPNNPA